MAMYEALSRFNQQGIVQPPPAPHQQPGTPRQLAADDYVTGADLQGLYQAAQQETTGRLNSLAEMAASIALGQVRQQFQNEFQRYGPEIQAMVARIPVENRTLDTLTHVVKLIRSEHLDEIAEERARQLATQMEPTLRSNGGAVPTGSPTPDPHTLDSEKIPADWRARAQRLGVTMDTIREFCRVNNLTVEGYFKEFEKSTIAAPQG